MPTLPTIPIRCEPDDREVPLVAPTANPNPFDPIWPSYATTPDCGRVEGLSHASRLQLVVPVVVALVAVTAPVLPFSVTPGSGSPLIAPGCAPSVNPPWYVSGLA